MPCGFVVVVVATSVAIFLMETFALAMAAPEMSVTLPEMVPPTTCPWTRLEQKTVRISARTAAKRIADFVELVSDAIGHLLKPSQLEVGLNFSPDSTPGSAKH